MRTQYFDDLVTRLGLRELVRRWNKPGGSKIASVSDLMAAITMNEELDQALADAIAECGHLGYDNFDEEIRVRLEPLIVGTLMLGVQEEARVWAHRAACLDPAAHGVETPFATGEAWIAWALQYVDRPITICGPDGSDIVEDDVLARILCQALEAEHAVARRAGW